jgi:zinc/manganese transport system substrate-binding protein
MNISRRHFITTASLLVLPSVAFSQTKLTIVTTFSILADLVRVIGGNRVSVISLVGLNKDAHDFSPRASDIVTLGKADLFVTNGLTFDNFAKGMVTSAKFEKPVIIASKGVKAISSGGGVDPHAWQDIENIKIYVKNIADALTAVDAEGTSLYAGNLNKYLGQLSALHLEIRQNIAAIPRSKRKIITSHDAFTYFGDAYDVDFYAPSGKITSEPTAQNIAKVIKQVKDETISALFLENMSNPRVITQIAKETGVKIGGTLYADSLSTAAPTYLQMMAHNGRVISTALK